MKLCKDCVNFRDNLWCCAPENGISLIDGAPIRTRAAFHRFAPLYGAPIENSKLCGPDAKYFSPKPPIKRKWWEF